MGVRGLLPGLGVARPPPRQPPPKHLFSFLKLKIKKKKKKKKKKKISFFFLFKNYTWPGYYWNISTKLTFLKRFCSLGGQSPSVSSSWDYLQNGWQFWGLNYNFPIKLLNLSFKFLEMQIVLIKYFRR
jgi:hypothetical protein